MSEWLPAVISAGSQLAGGLIGAKQQKKSMKMQLRAQKEFAQQGVRWRVADARAAGISPLAALGAATHSPSFTYTGDTMGDAIAGAGKAVAAGIQAKEAADMARQSHQAALMEAGSRMRANNAEAYRNVKAGDVAAQQHIMSTVKRVVQRLGSDRAAAAGVSHKDAIGKQKPITTPFGPWRTDPRFSETQEVEDRYGDIIGGLFGLGRRAYEMGDAWQESRLNPDDVDAVIEFLKKVDRLGKMRIGGVK